MTEPPKPAKSLEWVGSARRDIKRLPEDVRDIFGYALYAAQLGGKHADAKHLTGLAGGVLEVIADDDGNTYRAVYTVKLRRVVYVLHVFQKKSKKGIKTPKKELDLIANRLKIAIEHHKVKYEK